MNNPSVSVSITADIKALNVGLTQAEQAVVGATDRMGQAIDKAGLGKRLGDAFANAEARLGNMTKAVRGAIVALDALANSQGNAAQRADQLSQSLMAIPTKATLIVGGMYQIGQAISELFTGEQAGMAADQALWAANERTKAFRDQIQILERQLEITKESDPIKALELKRDLELLKIRKEMLALGDTISAQQARDLQIARENLVNAESERAIAEEIARQKERSAKAEKENVAAVKEAARVKPSQAGLVGSVTTSLGGTFNFAQNAVMQAIQNHAMKQVGLQQSILLTAQQILQLVRNGGTVIT